MIRVMYTDNGCLTVKDVTTVQSCFIREIPGIVIPYKEDTPIPVLSLFIPTKKGNELVNEAFETGVLNMRSVPAFICTPQKDRFDVGISQEYVRRFL